MKIGDVFWLQRSSDVGYAPRIPHPHVVIEMETKVDMLRVCAITTNMKKLSMPGNILLDVGEANLTKRSIIEVAKTVTITQQQLGDYIGTLSEQRIQQIQAGTHFIERLSTR